MITRTAVEMPESSPGIPVASIFGEVEPMFFDEASKYVKWVPFCEVEKTKIDVFITDLTIEQPRDERNRHGHRYGLVYGVAMASRLTAVNEKANVPFLVDSNIYLNFGMIKRCRFRGLLLKTSVPELLKSAIDDVSRGISFLDPNMNLARPKSRTKSSNSQSLGQWRTVVVEIDVEDLELQSERERLAKQLRRAWFPPKLRGGKSVSIAFTLDTEGQPINLRIIQASGEPVSDTAAEQAVRWAAPFKNVRAHVEIQAHFGYLEKK